MSDTNNEMLNGTISLNIEDLQKTLKELQESFGSSLKLVDTKTLQFVASIEKNFGKLTPAMRAVIQSSVQMHKALGGHFDATAKAAQFDKLERALNKFNQSADPKAILRYGKQISEFFDGTHFDKNTGLSVSIDQFKGLIKQYEDVLEEQKKLKGQTSRDQARIRALERETEANKALAAAILSVDKASREHAKVQDAGSTSKSKTKSVPDIDVNTAQQTGQKVGEAVVKGASEKIKESPIQSPKVSQEDATKAGREAAENIAQGIKEKPIQAPSIDANTTKDAGKKAAKDIVDGIQSGVKAAHGTITD